MKHIAFKASCAALIVLGGIALLFHGQLARAQAQNSIETLGGVVSANVTAAQLAKAGYTNVKVEPPANGRFNGSNQYFRVQEAGDPKQETSNIVVISRYQSSLLMNATISSIFDFGSDIHPYVINGGVAKESTTYDGRTLMIFIKNRNKVSVYGPDKAKLESLAVALAGTF